MKALESFVRKEHHAWDCGTYQEVVLDDCYRIANRKFTDTDVVIDVGANIGLFSGMALELGAGIVLSVEPSPINFSRLSFNLNVYGSRSYCWNRAVWRSDMPPQALHLDENTPDGNTGGISVLTNQGDVAVLTMALDDLIGDKLVTFLKVDCEGSEYPILYTAKRLSQVSEIVIECHPVNHLLRAEDQVGDASAEGLAEHLQGFGFETRIEPRADMGGGWAYLFAKRQ